MLLFSFRYLEMSKKISQKTSCALGSLTSQMTRSKMILKHINNRANAMLKNLEANFNAGKMKTSLRFAEDLLTFLSGLEDPHRYAIPAYRYLSLIHTALGRHDRACSNVAMMVRLSKSTKDAVLLSQALVTLGKVHLSFGHLEAAARAWENLSIHIDHPVPRAWVYHEIGRCHLETGKYAEALRKASQCRECAEEASSNKWTFHAGLLRAQCLATLGRFAGDDSISQPVVPESLQERPLFFFSAEFLGRMNLLSQNPLAKIVTWPNTPRSFLSRYFSENFLKLIIFNFSFWQNFFTKYNITLHSASFLTLRKNNVQVSTILRYLNWTRKDI